MNAHDRAVLFSSAKGDWGTPVDLFEDLNREFGFTLDAAANAENRLVPDFLGPGSPIAEDALAPSTAWPGRVFCNPPYGRGTIDRWVGKALLELLDGDTDVVVFLLPARTDTAWFRVLLDVGAEIRFIRGRLRFRGAAHSAPFPSIVAVLRRRDPKWASM